jgi:alpha-galactosidase
MNNTNLKIAYIGGGSRGWAWVFMTDLALEPQLGGQISLYDLDGEAAKNNAIIGNKISEQAAAVGKWTYSAADSLAEALTGADFVIISILPGTFREMRSDVHLPERRGVYQAVGDTTGPGGIIRALRTIPMFAQIATAIKEYAPEAWVINYTNPMAWCVRTLYQTFPEIKAFGCCHEVFGTQSLLAEMVKRKGLAKTVTRNDIHVNVMGINHFTWFDSASFQGHDLMPLYADFVNENYDTGVTTDTSHLPDIVFSCNHRVKFDLFRQYGWIAAAGDRHLAEFMPGERYLASPEKVREWGFYLTTVDWREKDLRDRLAKSKRLLMGEAVELKPSGEEGIALIKALCGLGRIISNVNLPNTAGQLKYIPPATVVETNALFSYNEVRPLMAGLVKPEVLALLMPHVSNQEMVYDAAVNCNRYTVYKAFASDPLLAGRLSAEQIVALANEMIANTRAYLSERWG